MYLIKPYEYDSHFFFFFYYTYVIQFIFLCTPNLGHRSATVIIRFITTVRKSRETSHRQKHQSGIVPCENDCDVLMITSTSNCVSCVFAAKVVGSTVRFWRSNGIAAGGESRVARRASVIRNRNPSEMVSAENYLLAHA